MILATAMKLQMAKMSKPPIFLKGNIIECCKKSIAFTDSYGYNYFKSYYLYSEKIGNKTCNFLYLDKPNMFSNEKELKKILPSSEKTHLDKGFVYVLQSDYGYKIGSTKKIKRRLDFFNIKLPFDFKLLYLIPLYNYKKYEKYLHNYFNSHINGEWFNLSKEDLAYIKECKLFS